MWERARILGKAGERARGLERTDLGMEGGLPVDAAGAAKGRKKDGSKDVCLPARTSVRRPDPGRGRSDFPGGQPPPVPVIIIRARFLLGHAHVGG